MTTQTRIYLVDDGHAPHLVRAPNAAQAIRHCARGFKAAVASQDELVALVAKGAEVEEIKSED